MINATKVEPTDDFKILIDLEDGRKIEFGMNYIHSENGIVIDPLKDIKNFEKVFIKNGIVTWPTGYDIDPYYLERTGTIVKNKSA